MTKNKLPDFFSALLGKFSWTSPPWVNYLRQRPKVLWSILLVLAVIILGSLSSYFWYKSLPKIPLTTAEITVPQITPLAEELFPDVLTINFGLLDNGITPQSVAPINMVNQEVSKGITISPSIPGSWSWQTESRLVFTPTEDWPAGQQYHIHFDKNVFAPNIKMSQQDYYFSTLPFKVAISEFKLYQDPLDPNKREAVATLSFNYPVDAFSLESKLDLIQQTLKKDQKQKIKFSTQYDKYKRTAYVHSETIEIQPLARYLEILVHKGIKAAKGTGQSTEKVEQNLLIPDMATYFKINSASANIVRNEQDRPEQILTIETSLGVKDSELDKYLHIYLLPQDHPATATEEEKTNYQWTNPGEVTPAILQLATPLNLQALPAEHDYSTLHSFKLNTITPRYIYLKIDKGMQGAGNFTLTQDYAAVIKVPEYPQEISFLHKGSLLALNSEKKLSVVIRGLPAVKFQIYRVLPDDVNQLVTQTSGKFNHPQFINYSFNQQNISELFSEIKTFAPLDTSNEQYIALDIGKYLATKANTNGPRGLFLLHAAGWDPDKKYELNTKSDRLILVTDLGLIVKDNQDGTHDVFVQSITTGKPISNAKVSILGKNGLPLFTNPTNENGRATFPILKDFVNEREPTAYLAKLGDDVSFIPYSNPDRILNYSRFDVGGAYINTNEEGQNLSAYLFSDRGIYRPGDLAHLSMIVKRIYAQAQPAGMPLQLTISDPKGTTVKEHKFTLDDLGFSTLDYQTNSTSPTGQYSVNLFIVKDNHPSSIIGSTTFKVAEFQPDRMRITANLSKELAGWVSPDNLTAKINLWNLYGAPAADRKVSAKVLLTPKSISFTEFPNYEFLDPLFNTNKTPKVFTDILPDTKTNAQGTAQLELNLNRFEKATYQLTLFAEGFEAESGRSVTTQTTALVSPLAYFIGYKPDGDLKYVKQNSQRSVNFIAINPQLKKQSLANLKIQLSVLQPVTTLVKNQNGTYQYQSIIQTKVISTNPYSVNEQGTNYNLPTEQIGNFAVTILDQNNTEISKVKYSVVGASKLSLAKNAELSVKLNKSEYVPDDEIEMQITAPYTGAGLITIERDKVYATQWFVTNSTNSVQKIRIPKDFQGNGYINVAFVRDWNSPEIFMSPLSYSIVPFSMNNANHAINIDLTTSGVARPGEPFTITYKSDKPGKIIVYAVDEGILQVANYETPDPLAYFFQKYALQVSTLQTVDQILPKFIQERELSAAGGDGGEEELRNYLNPFKRKSAPPVVYWSGIVDTDATPRQLTYNVPDYFNGTLRVMAVAVALDAVGSNDTSAEIRGDFVISPNVPTFVAPGDTFEITASIANNLKDSGDNTKVKVRLNATERLEILGPSELNLTINKGSEQTARFKLRSKSLLGDADLTFTVQSGDKNSKISSSLSVRPAMPYSTSVISGSSNKSSVSLILDRNLYPEHRDVEAAISTSPLILVYGLQRYLDNFPYGCTEQLVSKVFPLLAMSNQPWFTDNPRLVSDKIQSTIQMLGQRQMSSGGFSYWPSIGDYASNTFISVYAMHFLTEAKRLGYQVPNTMFYSGISYLKEVASGNPTSLEQARIQAYAIYILTRNELVTTNYLTNLQLYLEKDPKQMWQQDIISAYIAASYQLLKSYSEADKLIAYFKPYGKTTIASDFYNNRIALAEYFYLLARHFPDRLMKESNNILMPLITALNKEDINTIFSSYASIALAAYGQVMQTMNTTPLSINEIFENGKSKMLTQINSGYGKVAIDGLVKKVELQDPAKQYYFYQLTQAGFDKTIPTSALKQGLEVYRDYRDEKGNLVTSMNLGKEVLVHVRIRSLSDNYLNNIVVVDLLPGGFEVVLDSVKQTTMDYVDVREDRVIFFGGVGPEMKELIYRIKATNVGQYTLPPIYASSMYDLKLQARGVGGSVEVMQ